MPNYANTVIKAIINFGIIAVALGVIEYTYVVEQWHNRSKLSMYNRQGLNHQHKICT